MSDRSNSLKFLHFQELVSTNQKIYQLAEADTPAWTVVSCDIQPGGKGYGSNVWQTEPYKDAIFSFLLREPFKLDVDLPLLNMWICGQIRLYLSKCHVSASVKWPNDIMINRKKTGGILIENRIMGDKTRFTVVGIGINIYQNKFDNLPYATSVKKEYPDFCLTPVEFIQGLMQQMYDAFPSYLSKNYAEICAEYNAHLFRINEISVFETNRNPFNGIIRGVNQQGNLLVELENETIQEFRHKEIKLLSY